MRPQSEVKALLAPQARQDPALNLSCTELLELPSVEKSSWLQDIFIDLHMYVSQNLLVVVFNPNNTEDRFPPAKKRVQWKIQLLLRLNFFLKLSIKLTNSFFLNHIAPKVLIWKLTCHVYDFLCVHTLHNLLNNITQLRLCKVDTWVA